MNARHRLLACGTLLSLLLASGCQGAAPAASSASSGAASTAPVGSAAPGSPARSGAASGEAFTLTYPILTDAPVKLTYWKPFSAAALKYVRSENENEVAIEAQKRTGVTIEYIHPTSGQEKEQYNVMVASGDYPDIIGMGGNSAYYYNGGPFKAIDDGILLDLTEKLPQYAPDYWKVIQENDLLRKEITDDGGRIASFFKVKTEMDPPHRRIVVRADVLGQCGFEQAPALLADYEALFANMKERGMTPFTLPKGGFEPMFMGMYGLGMYDQGEMFMRDEQGTISSVLIRPELKEYLAKMAEWYGKGYISKDFVSMDNKQAQSEFDTKKLGVIIDAIVATYNRALQQGFEVVSTPYPRLNESDKFHAMQADTMIQSKNDTGISTQCKNPEVALQYLNFFFTEEGAALANWGVEGTTYTVEGGKKQYTDRILNNPDMDTTAAGYILRMHEGVKLSERDVDCHADLFKSPGAREIRMQYADDPNADNAYTMPNLSLNPEELSERTKIMTEIDTYASEMRLKFITGVEPIEQFDAYVKTIQGMGIDRAVEITQAAYDRFVKK